MTLDHERVPEINYDDYCDCGNKLSTDEEYRDGICEDCK